MQKDYSIHWVQNVSSPKLPPPPPPPPQARVSPPLGPKGGGGATLTCGEEVGEPNADDRKKSLALCILYYVLSTFLYGLAGHSYHSKIRSVGWRLSDVKDWSTCRVARNRHFWSNFTFGIKYRLSFCMEVAKTAWRNPEVHLRLIWGSVYGSLFKYWTGPALISYLCPYYVYADETRPMVSLRNLDQIHVHRMNKNSVSEYRRRKFSLENRMKIGQIVNDASCLLFYLLVILSINSIQLHPWSCTERCMHDVTGTIWKRNGWRGILCYSNARTLRADKE